MYKMRKTTIAINIYLTVIVILTLLTPDPYKAMMGFVGITGFLCIGAWVILMIVNLYQIIKDKRLTVE